MFTFHIPSKTDLLLCVVYLMTLLLILPIALNDWMMPGRNRKRKKKKKNLRQDSQCMLLGHGHVCLVILLKFTAGATAVLVVWSQCTLMRKFR